MSADVVIGFAVGVNIALQVLILQRVAAVRRSLESIQHWVKPYRGAPVEVLMRHAKDATFQTTAELMAELNSTPPPPPSGGDAHG